MTTSPASEWTPLDPGLLVAGLPLPSVSQAKVHRRFEAGNVGCLIVPAEPLASRPGVWRQVPLEVAALIPFPEQDASIIHRGKPEPPPSAWEAVLKAAAAGELRLEAEVVIPRLTAGSPQRLPILCPELDRPVPAGWDSAFHRLPAQLGKKTSSPVDVTALQAGLLQLCDRLPESHEASQSIEGEGRNLAGDYWHAIHHRRERDFGNAKYWFRRVGRHPILEHLSERIPLIAVEFGVNEHSAVRELLPGSRFDPTRFVDLVQSVDRGSHPDLRPFAEGLQWAEMLLLLEQTWTDASGR